MRVDLPNRGPDIALRWAMLAGSASFLCALISYNFVDIDLWHQMALIRESISAGHLIKADPYAYTPTITPWVDHEWGAGVIAYFATAWFGNRAIVVLKFFCALGTGALCVRSAKSRGSDLRLLAACAPVAILLAYLGFFTAIRAQAYSFLLLAALLFYWELGRRGKHLWMMGWLAIFPLCVNLHGGFIVAIVLTGLHLVEQFLRRKPARYLLLLVAGMCAEVLINPYGAAYPKYLWRALRMSRPYAPEWGPITGLSAPVLVAFIAALLVMLYTVVHLGLRHTPGILPLTATLIEAILHRKLLPFFAVAWICYLPAYLQQTPAGKWLLGFMERRRRFMRVSWIAFAGVCIVSTVRQAPWNLAVPQPIYPVSAVDYLARDKFTGNLLVPFRVGSYVSWKLYPGVKISLDGRYEEVYNDKVMGDVFAFYEATPGWRAALDSYPTDAALIPTDAPVASTMPQAGWTRTYRDRDFEIYVRPGILLPVEDHTSSSFHGVFP